MSFRPRAVALKKKPVAAASAPAPAASTSSASADETNNAQGGPAAPASSAMVPRAIAKRTKVAPAKPSPLSTLAVATVPQEDDGPVASTSKALAAVKLDPKEEQRLELLLSTIESCLCDWGLSCHLESGMLERLRDGKDGYVHFQQILGLPPVQALTSTQADVQKALKLRPSPILEVSDSGFQLRRKTQPDFERLAQMHPADWDDMTLYLENVPSIPGSATTVSSLVGFLSTLLSTQIQRLILPPLFDGTYQHDTESQDPAGQSEAFERSRIESGEKKEGRRKGLGLPSSGGPFKGFAFVVVEKKEDAEKALKMLSWERRGGEDGAREHAGDDDDEDEDVKMSDGKVLDHSALAKQSGLRAISYSRWLDLKAEYLNYQRSLVSLKQSHHSSSRHDRDRERDSRHRNDRRSPSPPQPPRDAPPHQLSSTSKRASGSKRAGEHPSSSDRPPKRTKRASSPGQWEKVIREPSPPRDDSEVGVDARGAFPKGCVLWIRNVHEKSSKTSLRSLFSDLLDTLEEGSGRGVEFVDYEKGLDVCHIRFSSAHLASLMLEHFNTVPSTHMSPAYLSSTEQSATPPENLVLDASRRPIVAQLVEGERERLYWQNLPESTRRGARKSAGGPVALVKKRKAEQAEAQATEGQEDEIAKLVEQELVEVEKEQEQERPRKRPSKI